ncbi:N-acetylmuramoyl-L-alanine amidase [Nocardia gipuzkoensis]
MPEVTVSVRTDFISRNSGKPPGWESVYQPTREKVPRQIDPATGRPVREPVPGSIKIDAAGPVSGAQVEIVGADAVGITNQHGLAVLNTDAVRNSPGSYLVRIRHSVAAQHTEELAGPGVADPRAQHLLRIYRQLEFGVELEGGELHKVLMPIDTAHGADGNRNGNFDKTHLFVDWKPVWIGSPVKSGELPRTKDDIDLIVVHHTAGKSSGQPIHNIFLQPTQAAAANTHYVIDVDGHVMKLTDELREANHAGCSTWHGRQKVNDYSIGIEIVHFEGRYEEAQYRSLIALIGRLRRAYPTIAAHRVVGHGDVATAAPSTPNAPCPTPALHSPRKAEDPGIEFDWARLEEVGLGMTPVVREDLSRYDPTFSEKPNIVLRRGDHDPPGGEGTARLGGRNWPDFIGNPIEQLQKDLETIGFSVRPDPTTVLGHFGTYTESAVATFQRHFFTGSRKELRPPQNPASRDAPALGRVDSLTASWINSVRV